MKFLNFSLLVMGSLITTMTISQTPVNNKKNLGVTATGNSPISDKAVQVKTVTLLQQHKANQRLAVSNRSGKELKNFTILTEPAEQIDISNIPRNEMPVKATFRSTEIARARNCEAVPVNYKSSQDEFSLFFPARSFREAIFPGAVYQFASLQNQLPVVYTKHISRNPMDLTIQIFDRAAAVNPPVVINTFDFGSLTTQYSNVMSNYPRSSPKATEPSTDVILAESSSQLNMDLSTAGSINMPAVLGLQMPEIPISIGITKQVSTAHMDNVNSNTLRQKNSVVIRYRQVYYSASVNYKTGNEMDVFPGVDKAQLEKDLVYVKSVDYGQVFYVVVTSVYQKDLLYNAVANKLKEYPELGLTESVIPLKGLGNNSIPTKGEGMRIFNDPQTNIQVYDYNGSLISLGTSIDEVLTNLKGKEQRRFNATNPGVPINYSLNFVTDHSPLFLNCNNSYALANCGKVIEELRYSVDIKLVKLDAPKVVDTDDSEDLIGNLSVPKFYIDHRLEKDSIFFWRRYKSIVGYNYDNTSNLEKAVGVTSAYENRFTEINRLKSIVSNISLNSLRTVKFTVTGDLQDLELRPFSYVCNGCQDPPREIKLEDYIDQIEALRPNESKALAIDEKDFFILHFYENNDFRSSHVRVFWSVIIKAKN
jgi:Thiol-activated cytolysin